MTRPATASAWRRTGKATGRQAMKANRPTDSQTTKPAASRASPANVAAVTVMAATAAIATTATAMATTLQPTVQSKISLQPRKNVRQQLLIL